ncbi:STI1-like protein [Eurytemora carolleeae]|uniref:STI1-like protein n=1 Tax=Eurytemora carolleeae TaxID=1294199 RepID=UPI000C776BB1|nr:STI1-like protein [Eurytemora carolleeae]|eukprot:XP_023330657.1 STI1-like protein [Eurytemora affinis]
MLTSMAHSKAVELKLTGNKFYGEGKYDEAVQKYKEGLAHNQADKQDKQRQTKLFIILKNNLALIYIKQGKFEEARDCCYDADDADSKLERTFIRCHQAFLGLDEQVLAYHSLCRGHNRVQSEAKKELMEAIDKMKKDYPSATVTQPTKNLTLRQIASEYFSKTNIPKVLKPGLSENKGKKTAGVSGDGLDPKPSAVCNDDGSESRELEIF